MSTKRALTRDMLDRDWKYLKAIANSKPIAIPRTSLEKLVSNKFVVAHYRDDRYVLTGLGLEALLRNKYRLAMPEPEPETSMAADDDSDMDSSMEAEIPIENENSHRAELGQAS